MVIHPLMMLCACLYGNSDSPVIENAAQYEYTIVREALVEVAQELAQAIVRDGEGATKFVL